ncbi:MAG: DUF1579 domain-containing protein [Planctomycetota bacterium]
MKTTLKTSLVALAFAGLAGLALADDADIQKCYEKFATPGAEHAKLAKLEGSFTTTIKGCGKEVAGTAERKLILNGLFLQEDFKGACPMTGGEFRGQGVYGYDNARKKWVSTWVDSMSSGVMTSEGTLDDKGTITWECKATDPVTGKTKKQRATLTIADAKTQTYKLYGTGEDGSEVLFVEVVYTKK